MINISDIVKDYERKISFKKWGKDIPFLDSDQKKLCRLLAEVTAYTKTIIPEQYIKYTIFDFDGKIENDSDGTLLDKNILNDVANKICVYCWGKKWEDVQKIKNKENRFLALDSNSQLHIRRKNGNNIVIYGKEGKTLGRSMLASLLMKEAIKLRFKSEHQNESYGWMDFYELKTLSWKNDNRDLLFYRNCDWLVLEDITQVNTGSIYNARKGYENKSDVAIKDFFSHREKKRLVTILTFRFNIIENMENIEMAYGPALKRILNKTIGNSKTMILPLTKTKGD